MANTATLRRGVLLLLTLGVLASAGVLGWRWMDGLMLARVEVRGTQHASPDSLAALAGVEVGQRLLDADPMLIADRVRRHPWVERAEVQRLPTGTLKITVAERKPAALVIDRRGRPSHYLDAHGFGMPLAEGAVYDVPLLRGLREAYHPVTPVQDSVVVALLHDLHIADGETDGLVSEVALRGGEVWAWTRPPPERNAIPVRLGRDGFADKLRRLHAFWRQAVVPQPDRTFNQIDLRFAGQIVTAESVDDE